MNDTNSDKIKVAELVGSGNLMGATEKYALEIINSRNAESLPVESIDDEIKALKICIEGLQNPESDLFIDRI